MLLECSFGSGFGIVCNNIYCLLLMKLPLHRFDKPWQIFLLYVTNK